MKKVALLIVCLLCFAIVHAEGPVQKPLTIGFKVGLNSSEFHKKPSGYTSENINNYLAGAYARINLSKVYIQPEIYFNTKGGKFEDDDNALDVVKSFDFKTVDVPILVGYKVISMPTFNLRLNAGPVLSFVTDKKVREQIDSTESFKDQIFGVQYGGGIDFMFLSLDFRVEQTGKFFKMVDTGDQKTRNYLISLGVKIF